MDGPGIMSQTASASQKAAAYEREVGLRAGRGYDDGEIRDRSEATLSGIMQSSDELLGLLGDLGSRLERVENVIAGPVPTPVEANGSKGASGPSCITDVIDERLSRARMMVSRLHNTVSRIERRIG